MPEQKLPPVTIENAILVYRNFAGKERQYNRAGDRNFNVVLDPDTGEDMIKDGWNVKIREAREEGEDPSYLLQVSVSYENKPPKVVMITSTGRTFLDSDTVEILDYAEFETVDIVINPYAWEVGEKSGIKAYLKTMFATIFEDELEKKYALVPEKPGGGGDFENE